MDALWRNLESLGPILKRLPELAAPVHAQPQASFDPCARFLSHAERVQEVQVQAWPGFVEQMRALKLRYPRTTVLFPNLRRLFVFSDISPQLAVFLPWFFSPSLTSFGTYGDVDIDVFTTAITQLAQVAPHVQELTHLMGAIPSSACALYSTFNKLTLFRCEEGITSEALAHLSQLPCLRTLRIGDPPDDLRGILREDAFAALVDLEVNSEASIIWTVADLVAAVTSPFLRTLNLRLKSWVPDYRTVTLVQKTICRHRHLTRLAIDASYGAAPDLLSNPLPISKFFCLDSLQSLSFCFDGIAVTDDDIPSMAAAWRNLSELRMSSDEYNAELQTTRFTPYALHLISLHMPQLRLLAIDFDPLGIERLELPTSRCMTPIMLVLDHIFLEESHTLPVAMHINTAYPNATLDISLSMREMNEPGFVDSLVFWPRIQNQFLPLLKRYRTHELEMANFAAAGDKSDS